MKRIHKYLNLLVSLTFSLALVSLCACNEKSDGDDGYNPSSSIAISSFRLRPDTKVMANLDSVFFSIDIRHGVIFNADSLPMGTDVTRLVPVIVYPSGITSATIQTIGGKYEETKNYKSNPTDSIDFSGDVLFTLVAENGVTSATYRLKVNVHKSNPDSIIWDETAITDLPSARPGPKAQKTVSKENKSYTFIREADDKLTLIVSDNLFERKWSQTPVQPAFNIDLSSITAADDNIYALSESGDLYSSIDGKDWTSTGKNWISIIGGYGTDLLGLRKNADGSICHTSWPGGKYPETVIDERFPVSGASNFTLSKNKWAAYPTGILYGGRSQSGDSSATWAFDGKSWVILSEKSIPALTDATIIPYFGYLQSSALWIQTEYTAWLLIGGRTDNQEVNPYVYVSYDSGVHWHKGDDSVQLPRYIRPVYGADAVVMNTPESANLSDAWTRVSVPATGLRRRIPHTVDGTTILWDCPYIYMFGGIDSEGKLYSHIRRGVLSRLTFAPII